MEEWLVPEGQVKRFVPPRVETLGGVLQPLWGWAFGPGAALGFLAVLRAGYDRARLRFAPVRRDKNQAIEAPRIILALIGLQTWLPQAGAKLSEKFIFSLVPI